MSLLTYSENPTTLHFSLYYLIHMKKTEKKTKEEDIEQTSVLGENMNELEEGLEVVDPEDDEAQVDLEDISIDEFMNHPEKLSKVTDDSDIEESTNWCPQCSDHTIFVNRVCTVCGFTKGLSKSQGKDDADEESTTFEILPEDEIVEDLGFGFSEDENDE